MHQHSTGYLRDSFTGQKTQPTVSKYTEGKDATKVKKTQKSKEHKTQQYRRQTTATDTDRQTQHCSISRPTVG